MRRLFFILPFLFFPLVSHAIVTDFSTNLTDKVDWYNDECLWFQAVTTNNTQSKYQFYLSAQGIDWLTDKNGHADIYASSSKSSCIPLRGLFPISTTTDIAITHWNINLYTSADSFITSYAFNVTRNATSTYSGPIYHAGTSTLQQANYLASSTPPIVQLSTSTITQLATSSGTISLPSWISTSTFPTYYDWLIANGMIIFGLFLIAIGFFFQLWERRPRKF